MTSLAIRGARIVTRDEVIDGTLYVEEDKISHIDSGQSRRPADAVIEAGGAYLLPGLVDLHGDDIEHELGTQRSFMFPVEMGVLQTDKNAVAWGVTTKLHALAYFEEERKGRSIRLSNQIIDTLAKFKSRKALLADHFVDLRYEITADPEYTVSMMDHPLVQMVACMDHTPGEGQFKDDEQYVSLHMKLPGMTEIKIRDLIREKKDRQHLKIMNMGKVAKKAKELGKILAYHDIDTREKVELMDSLGAKSAEMPISLDAARRAKELGWVVAMSAVNVVKGGSSSGNLSAELAVKNGVVDCLCSDFYLPAIVKAAFMLVEKGVATLPEAVRLVSLNAAEAVGLCDRGSIEPGKLADLILVDDSYGWPVVTTTVKCGSVVYRDGRASLR